jgi:hypothetical protein
MKRLLMVLLVLFSVTILGACEKEENEIEIKEVIEVVTIVEEKELIITERDVDIYAYTDILLWLLLNPNDDYRFYYEEGTLHELQVSTNLIEYFELELVVKQVLDSMTPEEIEGLTASIK